jgi:hypothetical protein
MALTKTPIELSSTPGIVDNSNATAITIDASENVLVGKTTTAFGTAGIALRGTVADFIRDGGTPINVNRLTNDGSLIDLHKNSAIVGSISTLDNNSIYIGNGEVNLRLIGVTNDIRPATSAGLNRDAAVDLGDANARFKDIYLSGGAFLGGTGAANKLEDYEEGTWTPTFSFTSGAANIATARYTKIGRQVILNLSFLVTSAVGAGNQFITFTAPFTQYSSSCDDIGIASVYPDGDNNNTGVTLNSTGSNNTQFSMAFTLIASFGANSLIRSKLIYETNQ